MKKVLVFLLCFAMLFTVACKGKEKEQEITGGEDATLATADDAAFTEVDGNKGLYTNGWRLDFVDNGEGFDIALYNGSTSTQALFTGKPVTVYAKLASGSLLGGNKEKSFKFGYTSVSKQKYGYYATVTATTTNGTEAFVEDKYYIDGGELLLKRKLYVTKENTKDKGIASAFALTAEESGEKEYFVPAIIYKNTENMPNHAIFANTNIAAFHVLETRTGLPMAMLRSEGGAAVAISHYRPNISNEKGILGVDGEVDNRFRYGSLGYEKASGKTTVSFRYPSGEGPATYNETQGWKRVYHKVSVDTVQEYSIGIFASDSGAYTEDMESVFRRAFVAEDTDIAYEVNIDKIWDYNIDMFEDTYKEFGSGAIKSAGVPWSMDLLDKDKNTPYSFQMGFVGQQTSVGASLLSEGYAKNNEKLKNMGKTILNFWSSSMVFSRSLPYVWWDPANNSVGGGPRAYSAFLRAFVDGCEGILDAYVIAKANGEDFPQWKNVIVKTANFLCENQNSDGSFYRAYLQDGSVNTDTTDPCIQGTSKANTPVAVRFLYKMNELTGESKYYDAATSAVEYSYQNLYNGKNKYVGGTIDQHNVVDREAAIFALYAFESAYSATGEEKYLQAAKHAAASALSWVYCYDFKVYTNADNAGYNPFENGGVTGFSIIATGHSGADNFASYLYYYYYRMYLHTGDTFYLKAAKLCQYNAKLSSDYDGRMKYAYRAIATEATLVARFDYYSVNAWLPWSSIANIDSIAKMRATFGNASVDGLSGTLDEQRATLADYGVGGKIN